MVALCKSQSSASLKQLVKAQEHYIVLREMCQLPLTLSGPNVLIKTRTPRRGRWVAGLETCVARLGQLGCPSPHPLGPRWHRSAPRCPAGHLLPATLSASRHSVRSPPRWLPPPWYASYHGLTVAMARPAIHALKGLPPSAIVSFQTSTHPAALHECR